MRIVSSEQYSLSSNYQKLFGREVNESLDLQVNGQRLQMQRHERVMVAEQGSAALRSESAKPSISPEELKKLAAENAPREAGKESLNAPAANPLDAFEPNETDLEKLRMLLAALARLSGDFESYVYSTVPRQTAPSPEPLSSAQPVELSTKSANNADFQLSYDYHVTQWQTEQLQVQNSGRVTTADGRQIDFDLNINMSRTEYSSESLSIRAGAALKDPLVVNWQGAPVQLQGGAKMSFDLDADGQLDSMARLAQGSAFLALDHNGNGRIDDGRELFGAISGDGFADLSAYDDDANGFIDAGDAVFAQLKLWVPDGQGQGQLLSLAEAGIGALSLKNVAGGFDLVADGELQGQVRSTGMFLFEDGRVGSMQQIDLVV